MHLDSSEVCEIGHCRFRVRQVGKMRKNSVATSA